MPIIPVVKRSDGVLISATPRGMWIENEHDDRDPAYLLHRQFADYRTRRRIEHPGGIVISPVGEDELLVTWPDHPPVYLTALTLVQVGFAIRQLRAAADKKIAVRGLSALADR